MADTIECPYCCNDPALRAGCRGCNGAGVIGMHNAPVTAVPAAPGAPLSLCALSFGGGCLYALDLQGRLWRLYRVDDKHGDSIGLCWEPIPGPVEGA